MTGRLASSSGAAQDEDPLEVPRHGHGAPFASYLGEAAQEELAESEHGFDDAEHRLRCLLAQAIELLAFGRSQAVGHGLGRRRVFQRRRRCGESLAERRGNAAAGRWGSAAPCGGLRRLPAQHLQYYPPASNRRQPGINVEFIRPSVESLKSHNLSFLALNTTDGQAHIF